MYKALYLKEEAFYKVAIIQPVKALYSLRSIAWASLKSKRVVGEYWRRQVELVNQWQVVSPLEWVCAVYVNSTFWVVFQNILKKGTPEVAVLIYSYADYESWDCH